MPPNKRMLWTKIWFSDQFSRLSVSERLLYIGTITLGDDDGRLKGGARFLKSQIFPYDEKIGAKKVEKMRDKIREVGLVSVYEAENEFFIFHPNWEVYQALRNDRYKPSRFPPPPGDILSPSGNQTVTQQNQTQTRTEENKNTTEKNPTSTDEIKIISEKPKSFRDVVNKEIKKTGANWQIQP